MNKIRVFLFFFFCLNFYIKCINVQCSSDTDGKPSSKYHCSGLIINQPGDSHCCLWKFVDTNTNKSVTRCSSISEKQFNDLDAYILKKSSNYNDLEIECTADQEVYCSNILLDQEHISNCNELPIYDTKDKFCCRWQFTDNTYDQKSNDYCASINEYQFITIQLYVNYKEKKGNGRYDALSIDCFGVYINNLKKFLYILLLTYL